MKKNWYLMKNITLNFIWILTIVVSIFVFSSCSLDPVDKTYSKHTADDDYRRIKEISSIDSTDAVLLGKYMIEHGLVGAHVLELHATYKDILNEAKKEKEKYEIEKRKKGKNEIDVAKSHEVEKIRNLQKVLSVDFVKEKEVEPENNFIISRKLKKPAQAENKNSLSYNVLFKNVSSDTIQAFKGEINFYDIFQSEIKKVSFTSFRQIPPDSAIVQKFTINLDEVNKSGNIYYNLDKKSIKVEWLPDRLFFTNGNIIE
jgi:hypothetical protein